MTAEERQALGEILEYMTDEQSHYESCTDEGEKEAHIYNRMMVMENYLKRTRARNFDDPLSNAIDEFLADGGEVRTFIERAAEVFRYASPQLRESDDEETAFDLFAEHLESAPQST